MIRLAPASPHGALHSPVPEAEKPCPLWARQNQQAQIPSHIHGGSCGMTKRFLFIQLPFFAIERFRKEKQLKEMKTTPWWDEETNTQKPDVPDIEKPASPLVLVASGAKGTRITALGPDALQQGFYIDMKLADARSIMPNLQVEQHNRTADAATLNALASWLLRYTPAVSIHGDNGFLLDTTGCDHLFGGERSLLNDIQSRLKAIGFTARLALCDHVGAAIALVSHGRDDIYILPKNHAPTVLDALPVDALRLDDDTLTVLRRLGLRTIGDLRPLPRISLEKRFRTIKKSKRTGTTAASAQSVQWRLDQMSGAVKEPLLYIKEPLPFRTSIPCPELALEPEAVALALDKLLPRLMARLGKAGLGARGLRLIGSRADGGSSYAEIHLSQPNNDSTIAKRLFRDRLDQIDCGFGIDLFVLEAINTQKISAVQNGMIGVETPQQTASSLSAFADIVNHKTNRHSVIRFAPRASHVPERSQYAAKITDTVDWEQNHPTWSPRPLRLLARPEPADVTAELPDSPPAQFIWRKVIHRVVRARGPERILPEWWRDELDMPGRAGMRDYYDVEDSEGMRYWLYRSIKDHVIDEKADERPAQSDPAARANPPKKIRIINWFVHGFF